MDWFNAGAAIIAFLFGLNFVAYLVRARRPARGDVVPRGAHLKRRLTGFEICIHLAVMLAWATSFGATRVAPGSAWGQAMARPWALASLLAWLMAGAVVVTTAYELMRRRRKRKSR